MATSRRLINNRWGSPPNAAAGRLLIHRQQQQHIHIRTLMTVGIARETYNVWERRAPLSPAQVETLLRETNNNICHHHDHDQSTKPTSATKEPSEAASTSIPRLSFLVQPSAQRIFSDRAYQEAGALLSEDLTTADIVLGVKRPKDIGAWLQQTVDTGATVSEYNSNKPPLPAAAAAAATTHLLFSHTVKGQAQNMDLLQACLDHKIQLLDYERMIQYDDTIPTTSPPPSDATTTTTGKRLVAFGRHAGLAGTMDVFAALGRRLLHRDGCATPFLSCPAAWQHESLEAVVARVDELGDRIQHEGMNMTEPLVVAVTGKGGSVHQGAMELLTRLPHEIVSVEQLPALFATANDHDHQLQHQIYLCPVGVPDVYEHHQQLAAAAPNKNINHSTDTFDRVHFRNHPAEYRSLFASRVAPYVHCIINAVYWDARFPRLLTKEQTRKLFERGQDRLLVLADISCDVNGSFEFLDRTTTIEKPFFQYDPLVEREVSPEIGDYGITVMGVDILPTELARESSQHFGTTISKVVQDLLEAKEQQDWSISGIDTDLLNQGLARSCITTTQGQLAPPYRYLRPLLDKAKASSSISPHATADETMVLSLEGHLFDSGLINLIADAVESHGCGMNFRDCVFPAHGESSPRTKSSLVLVVSGPDRAVLDQVHESIISLTQLVTKAEAAVSRIDRCHRSGGEGGSSAKVTDPPRKKRALLLGAGRVSKTCLDRLSKSDDVNIMIVCDSQENAAQVVSSADPQKAQSVVFDITQDLHRLSNLVEESDLVVSLLPAPLHPLIATECLVHRKHFVTASYESDELRTLGQRANDLGLMFLNEVGLDPGLDHMSAMKIIDDIKTRGGQVTAFSSFCGGLPAPEAANNPLKYKFSWNPKGVISASRSDARYRWEGHEYKVSGRELLQSALPFHYAWPELDLEYLPNRDSIHYEQVYDIAGAETLFRGTLRYHGFSRLMNVFQNMGLFETNQTSATTWAELIDELRKQLGGFANVYDFILACSDDDEEVAKEANEALEWLDLRGSDHRVAATTVDNAFCDALQEYLQFSLGERDMVIMHHTIEAAFGDSFVERHHADLQVFGDDSASAMAKTVGYTTAASAELILDGSLEGKRGLLLPTDPDIYTPVLNNLVEDGISFEEGTLINPLHVYSRE